MKSNKERELYLKEKERKKENREKAKMVNLLCSLAFIISRSKIVPQNCETKFKKSGHFK